MRNGGDALPDHVYRIKEGEPARASPHWPRHIYEIRQGIYYRGREFYRISGFKANYAEAGTHTPYWISGPRRDGQDRLYSPSGLPVEIDDDVREEYWRDIRKKPEHARRETA